MVKISIVTAVYNDPRVELCLRSVSQQQGDFEIEHIIVDGNSTDDTADILQKNEDQIDVLLREDDDGMYDAINKGIGRATGDVIGILNSDDRYQDESVLADVASVMGDTTVDVCYGDLVYVNEDDEIVRYWQSGSFNPYKFYFGWMPPHPTFFVRREVYDELGGYDISIPISADYEFMLRYLLENNLTVRYLDRILVRMALGGMSNSSVSNIIQVIKDMYRAWEKHGRLGKYTAPFLHPLEKVPQLIKKPPK